MSIRPVDMQTTIHTLTNSNQNQQHVNQVNANAHANITSIKKEQTDNKEMVKDLNNSRRVDPLKDDEEKKKREREKAKEKENKKDNDDNNSNNNDNDNPEDNKEKDKDSKENKDKKKNFIYMKNDEGKLEVEETDQFDVDEEEKVGHIDIKA